MVIEPAELGVVSRDAVVVASAVREIIDPAVVARSGLSARSDVPEVKWQVDTCAVRSVARICGSIVAVAAPELDDVGYLAFFKSIAPCSVWIRDSIRSGDRESKGRDNGRKLHYDVRMVRV